MKIITGCKCDSCEEENKTCMRFNTRVFKNRFFFDLCYACIRRSVVLAMGGVP